MTASLVQGRPMPGEPQPLSPLREELLLHEAPRSHDGAEAWTLEDPGRGLFFLLTREQVEMLYRWRLGQPERVAQAVREEAGLDVARADVEAFARFLEGHSLLRMHGPAALRRYARDARAGQRGWLSWLLHNYLYFRIPLLRPDAFLGRTLPFVRRVFLRREFAWLTVLAGLAGLFLAARQWDEFKHTFLHFFTLEGAVVAALALGFAKSLHELAHAYVAKRHGCRVSTMGVAFIVMWPVLYTDVSGAWRLASRGRRLAIGAAGMGAELALGAWCVLAWTFLPDGVWRSAAFVLGSTTWLMTLAVNLNPFMRFDGYFLLSDALNVPNLQNRAFALARWRLREALFGFGDARPEAFARWRERTLLAYAFGVWIYRFFLFLAIALLVYHKVFKLLGILLFAVEIVFFVLKPIYSELRVWVGRLRGTRRAGWNRRSWITLGVLALLVALAAIPWHTRVRAPALLRSAEQARLVAPAPARLARIEAAPGRHVAAGDVLFVLQAPDLEHELRGVRQQIDTLAWQRRFQLMRRDTAAAVPVAEREWLAALERRAVLERQLAQLAMRAPFAGVMADMAEPLAEGEWVGAGEWMGTLVAPGQALVEAYASESDVHRIRVGDRARFVPEDSGRPAAALRVAQVDATATRRLASAPELASPNGGAIAAVRAPGSGRTQWDDDAQAWQPEQAVYRVMLQSDAQPAPPLALRGTAMIYGQAESLLARAWRRVVSVLVREAGF